MYWDFFHFFFAGYLYECLDNCQCDTDDEAIHCHSGQRETLTLPKNRLRGFSVIGMTYNNIKSLPAEEEILKKFPDIRAIDVERNPNFDCSTLSNYKTVTVGALIATLSEINEFQDCNFSCFAKKHYEKLHTYVLELWKVSHHDRFLYCAYSITSKHSFPLNKRKRLTP
ncbi:unnamed protein product [Enterobius vermicularis]|uniref:Uncharacterized protein n=1 Tax=Enterobius vermicularis TaxID=51028 RepID=A0A3P6IG88_ENTVE|nr:unnamed protein product [Enterobius vermicularis]